MARTLTDAEIGVIASKVADEIDRRRSLEDIERLRQVARLEDELRKAKEQVDFLATRNTFLQKTVSELTGPTGLTAFPTAGYPTVPAPAAWSPAAASSAS